MIAGNLRSHRRNQFIVLHPRRAGSRTSQATQATVKMTHHRRSQFNFTLIQGIHHVHPSPWRIHLRPQNAVTRASRQTKPTMHASIDKFWLWRMLGVEDGGGHGDGGVGGVKIIYSLSTIHHSPFTINSQLPTPNFQLLTPNSQLLTSNSPNYPFPQWMRATLLANITNLLGEPLLFFGGDTPDNIPTLPD